MATRLPQQSSEQLIQRIKAVTDELRQLKASSQSVEAKMYVNDSGNSYDITGTLSATTGGTISVRSEIVRLIITATSVDGAPFLANMTPQLWIPNMATPYQPTITTPYTVDNNTIITDDTGKVQFWYQISATQNTSASTYYFKYLIYSSAPVTVTVVAQ
jgi:hypothetical protein